MHRSSRIAVVHAATGTSLFGYPSADLQGRHLSHFVDVFRTVTPVRMLCCAEERMR